MAPRRVPYDSRDNARSHFSMRPQIIFLSCVEQYHGGQIRAIGSDSLLAPRTLSCVVKNNRKKRGYPRGRIRVTSENLFVFWVGEILPDRFSSRRNEHPATTRRSCRNAHTGGSKVCLVPIVTTHHADTVTNLSSIFQ